MSTSATTGSRDADTTGNTFTQNRRFNDSIGRLALSYKFGGI